MSIIKHVTLQKIVARDFRYVPRTNRLGKSAPSSAERNLVELCLHSALRPDVVMSNSILGKVYFSFSYKGLARDNRMI